MNKIGRLLLGKDVPAPKSFVLCRGCGTILTSPQSIKWGEGKRCRWKRQEKEGTRVYRPRRKRGDGQGMPISDVEFTDSGGSGYRRKKY